MIIISGTRNTITPLRNQSQSADARVNGIRRFIEMIPTHNDHVHWAMTMNKVTNRMLLAIGGPKNFEWLPDYGYQSIVVPIMPPSEFIFNNEPHLTDLTEYGTAIYYKQVIADGSLRKEVYVEMDYLGDPLKALKNYLLEQFMLMEDPTS